MSEEIGNDDRLKVTSVGNSWIVCKSKSHPGHVYYFNSLTGETAWNLSDAEIEKANNRTKHLGTKPTKCPEPTEKPPSTLLKKKSKPPQSVSSNQFVINWNSEQPSSNLTYSNSANSNSTYCTPFNQRSGVMQSTQINNLAAVRPVHDFNSFNNSLSTYHLDTTPMVYNPKIWAVPNTQPLFIAPVLATAANHNSGTLNVAYNQTMSHHATGLVFKSFDNPTPSALTMAGSRAFYPRDFNHDQGAQRTINKKVGFTNKNDLRQKLTFKKRFNMKSSIPGGSGFSNTTPKKDNTAAPIANKVEGIHSNDLSTGMESRCQETQLHEPPSKINVGPLKTLAPSGSNSDAWFIVVDLEVLLHEFKFLTTLTDSDEKCYLMVPKRVMEELKSYVTSTENIQAKRILRFLSQQIEIGHAYMAEEPSEVEGDSMAEVIYSTCKELLAVNYHLILLTNDNELLTNGSTNINKFSVDEIKHFLMEIPNKQLVSSGPKKPFMSNELINKIKIIVPNNGPQKIDLTSPVRDIQSDDHIENIPTKPPKQNNTPDKTEQLIIFKHTVDAGIQTDLEDINASISMTNVVEKELNADTNLTPKRPPVSLVSNNPDKKREIKLKRSTSHQPPVMFESEKKQFKWRRRTYTSLQTNEEIPSHSDQNMNKKNEESLQTNTLNNKISKLSDTTLDSNVTLGRIENKILDDSFDSRDSSIYAEPENSTTKENITIEETSTSGIISNTESNVDGDSINSNSINQELVGNGQSNKVMYEVDSITMEQYLKTKCDEWISRFIQIMEEVLTQVLQQDPPFTHSAMPPPWTLHEAAQCVAMQFRGHQSIISAANKLSNILFQVSDAKGQITMNMSPYQYMQMYSYGVHLLAAIMEVTTSCEDIQTAVESLNKLLHDIRNPNMDSSSNDVFSENKLNNMSNNDVSAYSDVPDNSDESSLHEQEILSDCSYAKEVPKDKKSISSEEELQKPVKFIRNIDIPNSFFKSLGLQKISQVQSREEQNLTHSQTRKGDNPQNANETTEDGTDSDLPPYEPNIIRKFSKFPKLEEKLKSNYNLKFNEYEDELDYEYETEDYNSADENYNEQRLDVNDNQNDKGADTHEAYEPEEADTNEACEPEKQDTHEAYEPEEADRNEACEPEKQDTNEAYEPEEADTNEACEPEKTDTNEAYEPITLKDYSLLSDENSKKFKYMTCMLLREIRDALNQVRVLCDQCYEDLKNPEESTGLKYQLRKRAERAHLHTIRLCRSLESMLNHETNNPTKSMYDFLEQADIDIRHVDTRLLFEYRITVAKCKDHANEFLSSIQNIITGIER